MEDVITRLRVSKQKTANEDYQPGYKAGLAWAANRAETIELHRLEEFCQAVEPPAGKDDPNLPIP